MPTQEQLGLYVADSERAMGRLPSADCCVCCLWNHLLIYCSRCHGTIVNTHAAKCRYFASKKKWTQRRTKRVLVAMLLKAA